VLLEAQSNGSSIPACNANGTVVFVGFSLCLDIKWLSFVIQVVSLTCRYVHMVLMLSSIIALCSFILTETHKQQHKEAQQLAEIQHCLIL